MKYDNKTITLREQIDLSVLRHIVRSFHQLPLRQDSISRREEDGRYIDMLNKYLVAMEAGHGSINVQYKRGPSKAMVGRYFAELKTLGTSLQGMPREIRHTLVKDIMDDIDIRSWSPLHPSQYSLSTIESCHYKP
jgi:hypothetical protein